MQLSNMLFGEIRKQSLFNAVNHLAQGSTVHVTGSVDTYTPQDSMDVTAATPTYAGEPTLVDLDQVKLTYKRSGQGSQTFSNLSSKLADFVADSTSTLWLIQKGQEPQKL